MQSSHETFYVLDFDRTLGGTNKLYAAYTATLDAIHPGAQLQLDKARREAEANHLSFDPVTTGRELFGDEIIEQGKRTFMSAEPRSEYMNDGAHDLLRAFIDRHIPYGIVTYGSKEWQEMKLEMAALTEIPTYIIPVRGEKGRLISSWWDEGQGQFVLPEQLGSGTAGTIILVDDKLLEFDDLHESASGVWYDARKQHTQGSDVPHNVRRVESLGDVLEA